MRSFSDRMNRIDGMGTRGAVCLIWLLLGIGLLMAAQAAWSQYDPYRRRIELFISDFGINNGWRPGLQPYGDSAKPGVVPNLAPGHQILIPMPADRDLPHTPEARQAYRTQVEQRLTGTLSRLGGSGGPFEVQLIQNINSKGYAAPWRQNAVTTWASDVYAAVGGARSRLERSVPVQVTAVVGSNGANVLAGALPRDGAHVVDRAIAFDPRISTGAAARLYRAVSGNLTIVNTHGDAPSGPAMLALHSTAKLFQQEYPQTRVLLADTGKRVPFTGHLDLMNAGQTGAVKQWNGRRYEDLGRLSGWELVGRPAGPASAAGHADRGLGGIDLSDLRLTCVAAHPGPGGITPLFAAAFRGGQVDEGGVRLSSRLSLHAFHVGLALPEAVFWVNLNPLESHRILDDRLARTDVGRVLLEADYQMKIDGAARTNPIASPEGRAYWRRIEAAAGKKGRIRQGNRSWIVPGRILLAADGDQAYLQVAELEVRSEAQYVAGQGRGKQAAAGELAYRELVLPHLNRLVNGAEAYAELRQVYAGLIFAHWFRERYPERARAMARRPDSAALRAASPLTQGWDPRAVWREYVASYNAGEYRVTEEERQTRGRVTHIERWTYVNGGVDFTHLVVPAVERLAPGVRAAVSAARTGRAAELPDHRLLFGDVAALRSYARSRPRGSPGGSRHGDA